MIVIVDFDGTLALGTMSRIVERKPNKLLIERLKELKRTINPIIKVVTARGSRFNLTEEQKRKRYYNDIERWLMEHNVPYDHISFNKEYGSIYIDDMTIGQYEPFEAMVSPFTKNQILFTLNTVIKHTPNAVNEYRWYRLAQGIVHTPDVLFCNDEVIILNRISNPSKPMSFEMIDLIESYRNHSIPNQPFSTYAANINHVVGSTEKVTGVIESLPEHENTFFHGDLSTTNVLIEGGTRKKFCIDSNYKDVFGSYLTDAGKAFFSFVAYEKDYTSAKQISDYYGADVVRFAVAEGLRVCKYQPKYISIVNNIADLV